MTDRSPCNLTHHSYWLKQREVSQRFPAIEGVHETDVAIIGGGITGLSTGMELLERGYKVAIFEALVIGGGTTGGSTGHLDSHPEHGAKTLIQAIGKEKAKVVTRLRSKAIDTIEKRVCSKCDFRRIPAFQYSENKDDKDSLREEFDAALQIGLQAKWSDRISLPYNAIGFEISQMARFQPLEYLRHLTNVFVQKGGTIFERSVVTGPVEEQPTELDVGNGKVKFAHVVCATHCNYTNAMRIYLQTPAYQSYAMAVRVGNPCSDGLYWDNSDPYFYTRWANSEDENLLVVGGCDHRTGVGDSAKAQSQLMQYVSERYDVKEVVREWSAELYEPIDRMPIIGLVPGKKNVWIATGLSGIGLTWGTVAGEIIAAQIQGKETELEDLLSPSRFSISSALTMASEQITSAVNLAERVLPADKIELADIQIGEGKVGMLDGKFTAACRDRSGNVHVRNPRCVHMGGVVHWNKAEQTWDCPVHGGRYAACGERIYSPPEADLVAPDEVAKE